MARAPETVRDGCFTDLVVQRSMLVAVSRCIAARVLGEEIAVLSKGTLSVVVGEPESESEEEPVLTLIITVDNSAFLLYENAAFGPLDSDPRTYVFKPGSEGTNEG